MWGGAQVANGRVTVDYREFMLWLTCINNRVIDEEACVFLKERFHVDVQPDPRETNVQIPERFKDERRLKVALEKAAVLNYVKRMELEAKRHWRVC
jgi:hypothetical protein